MSGSRNPWLWAAGAAAGAGIAAGLRRRLRGLDLSGRTALVSGGSRGLGLAIARELAAKGARVGVLARDRVALAKAQADLRGRGAEARAVRCDVRNRESVIGAVEEVEAELGPVDVLVNNAGVILVAPLDELTERDFEDAMATHLFGSLHLVQAVLPGMRRRGEGRIVNIASIGGKAALPHLLPYCASKFALVGFSDGLRAELAGTGVAVTTVVPGLMRTGSIHHARFRGRTDEEFAWFARASRSPFSTSAQSAARQIVSACRYGRPRLTITFAAKALAVANELAPTATSAATAFAARHLPDSAGGPHWRPRLVARPVDCPARTTLELRHP